MPQPHFPRPSQALAVVAAGLLLAVASGSHAADSPTASPFPGLELVATPNVARLYRRPDADLSDYTAVLIGAPAVEFSKNWKPGNYGKFPLNAAQLKKIRIDVANLARSVFTKVLSDGGYRVVNTAADGVLEITPNILDLSITAPDVPSPGRSKSFVMNAGSMTLALQVNDAVTGTLLAVVYDKKNANHSSLQWSTAVSNRAAASAVLQGWADQLKAELDAARAQ